MSKNKNIDDLVRLALERASTTDLEDDQSQLPEFSHLASELSNTLMSGELLNDWQVSRILDTGGMSEVYLVNRTHEDIKQTAALKLLIPELRNTNIRERFLSERQILVNLDHPHIAKLFDLGHTDDPHLWYVMEYIEGENLIEYAQSNDLSIKQRVAIFTQVCDAITHAHSRGVIHRDIKPANVIVNSNNQIKLLDFGIALTDETEGLTQTGAVLGTPGYMSPEQAKGLNSAIDVRSDIFSLGVLVPFGV